MGRIRRKFEMFCFRNRNKGISNLMLYIALGSGLLSVFAMINGGTAIYELMLFDKRLILQGQVWRLFTWLFVDRSSMNPLLDLIFLYFFYQLGRSVELSIGTFKFNLLYVTGLVLMDAFAMIFCPVQDVIIGNYLIPAQEFSNLYSGMAFYLHLSLVLAFATCHPDSQFMIAFIIPVRAWVMALVYLVWIGIHVFNMCYPVNLLPHALFPLVGLLNYFFLFAGDMSNLLPLSWRAKLKRRRTPARRKTASAKPIPFPGGRSAEKQPYNHRCTVCGRTDISNPELEFRYCSRCNGYHCYCQEHINDHSHIE